MTLHLGAPHRPSSIPAQAFIAQQAAIQKDVEQRTVKVKELQEAIETESDPLKKQEMMVQVREEQLSLTEAAKSIDSVSGKLDMVVDFLASMQNDLAAMNNKLDALQDSVNAIHESVQRLTGKWKTHTS